MKIHANQTHGASKGYRRTKEFMAYSHILDRCNNSRGKTFKYYGGRGIKCLFNSFQEFLSHIGPAPNPKYTVERIDNNGHYKKGNIKWATWAEQARNKRRNIRLTYKNQTLTLSEWAINLGASLEKLRSRYKLGWPTEKILDLKTNFKKQPHKRNRK